MSAAMMKELRRTSIVVLLMIASLFVSTSVIQVVANESLRDHPRNSRTFYANISVNRGPILVGGVPVAYSVPIDGPIAYQRVYDDGPLYAPVTGYLTIGQGNTGLEAALNSYLTGATGGQFFDQITAVLTGQKPQGAAVETTIDAKVQQAAWDALGDKTGAVLAWDPTTGRILAMVSKPSFDPNTLAIHDTPAVIDRYNALLADPGDPLINRTMNGDLDPPGSVFKLVVASAALEHGYSPESTVPNVAALPLPQSDHLVYNHSHGRCGVGDEVSIFDAVRLSCNIPMAELGQRLTYGPIRDQALAFGFGESVSVPMTSTPSVYPRVLDEPRTMLSAFGQDDVRASPLQMAMVAGAIANDGTLMRPSLVEAIVAADQTTLESFEPTPLGQPISVATARAVKAMMVASVDNGAASNAAIPGLRVAGKTGTAENGADDPYSLWFVGFAPADDPQVAVAVVVQDGGGQGQSGSGAALAAPVGKAVIEAVMGR